MICRCENRQRQEEQAMELDCSSDVAATEVVVGFGSTAEQTIDDHTQADDRNFNVNLPADAEGDELKEEPVTEEVNEMPVSDSCSSVFTDGKFILDWNQREQQLMTAIEEENRSVGRMESVRMICAIAAATTNLEESSHGA